MSISTEEYKEKQEGLDRKGVEEERKRENEQANDPEAKVRQALILLNNHSESGWTAQALDDVNAVFFSKDSRTINFNTLNHWFLTGPSREAIVSIFQNSRPLEELVIHMKIVKDKTVNINLAVQLFKLIIPYCQNVITLRLVGIQRLESAWSNVKNGFKGVEESPQLNK